MTMIEELKQAVKGSCFDAAMIVSPENRFYFTGFASSDGYLIVTAEKAFFITDGRYIEAAENKIQDCEVILQQRSISQLNDILSSCGVKSVGIEASRLSVSDYTRFANAFTDIEIVADDTLDTVINRLRSVKTADEVKKIIKAQRIAEAALEHICGFIKTGLTEKEISLELDYFMLSHGAQALSFETIAVSGKKSSMPHGVPDEKVVRDGDFITMDFGAVVDGYHSDMTRTVALGHINDEQKKVYQTVLEAQCNALGVLKSGLSCRDADSAARSVIEQAGYGEYFTHSTGHGVGVEIHESPNLSPIGDKLLEAGNIVTVEPGIYLPGKFGVRIEDMALITPNGCENLTSAPKELIIL